MFCFTSAAGMPWQARCSGLERDDRIQLTKLRELSGDVPDFPEPGIVFCLARRRGKR